MEWLWTWGGKSFGYRLGNSVFAQSGLEVGRLYGEEIYGRSGAYLGELRSSNRLIVALAKKGKKHGGFSPRKHGLHMPRADHAAYVMPAGFEEFPTAEVLA